MKLNRIAGATSEIWQVFIQDSSSSTGQGLSGLVFNTAGLTAYYHRDTDTTATAVTLVTMTVGTFTSSGFKEIDATNMKGWYQFCPPNAALAAGAKSCAFHLFGATNMAPLPIEVDLDPQVDVRQWLGTAVTAAASGVPDVNSKNINNIATTSVTTISANLGTTQPVNFTGTAGAALVKVDVTDWLGTVVATPATAGVPDINVKNINNVVAATPGASGGLLIAGSNAATTLASLTISGSMTVTGGITAALTGNITGNLSGSVGSVTGAVGSVTGNVGGNVTGSVGSVVGSVGGNVTGSVGSVVGSVGGNVTGSVASVVGNVGGNVVGTVASVVGNVSGNVSGNVTGSVGSVVGNVGGGVVGSVGGDLVGTIGGLALGAVTDVEDAVWDTVLASHSAAGSTGEALAVAAAGGTDPWATMLPGAYSSGQAGFILGTNLDAPISGLPDGAENADALLARNMMGGSDGGRTVSMAFAPLVNKWTNLTGTYTVYEDDDTTVYWTSVLTLSGAAVPIIASDPV